MKKNKQEEVKYNRRNLRGARKLLLIGIGLISTIGLATKMILPPKSQKKITLTISKDAKNTVDNIAEKSDGIKSIIGKGYHNINNELQKVTKKIFKELD